MRAAFITALALAATAAPRLSVAEGEAPATSASPLSLLRQIDEGFVQVFEKVAPAVVVIEASKRADETEDREDARGLDFFFRPRDDAKERKDKEKGKEAEEENSAGKPDEKEQRRLWRMPGQQSRSEGSGFIVRENGFILTNHHVVSDADKINVRLKDGRRFAASIVGSDDKTDIAVLKIEAKDLPVADMGDSDTLRIGQLVCAIGAPFNQDYSFTCGWVSGKGRTNLLGPTSPTILYEDYIQTDAFINSGNSGGPLFDVDGRIIGMNTLINGIGRGLAFAIPSNMLQEVSAQLISLGRVQRPWLGIRIETLSDNVSLRDRVTGVENGVLVNTIEADAPAYKSDLRAADVITEVDGVRLASARDLQKEILKKKVGQTVQLTVWRSGAVVKVPVMTGELPGDFSRVANLPPKAGPTPKAPEAASGNFGLELKDARPSGALVGRVEAGSAALNFTKP